MNAIREVIDYLENVKQLARQAWAYSPAHYMALVGVPLADYLAQCDKAIKVWKELEHAESLRSDARQVQGTGNEREGGKGEGRAHLQRAARQQAPGDAEEGQVRLPSEVELFRARRRAMGLTPDPTPPGQPELMNEFGTKFYGRAKTDGAIWWYEERLSDGTVKRHALMPVHPIAR